MSQLEQILLNVSASPLIDQGQWDEACHLLLSSLQTGLQVARVSLWFYADDGQVMQCQTMLEHGLVCQEETKLSALVFPRYFAALRAERAIVADHAQVDEKTSEFTELYLKPKGIAAMLDLPVRHFGRMIGIICCEHIGDTRHWQDDEVRFAAGLADQVGRAMNAAQYRLAQQQLESLNQQLEQRVELRGLQLADNSKTIARAHEQLLAQAKLATLGGIVAGVAHEVSTPLGVAVTASSHQLDVLAEFQQKLEERKLTSSQGFAYLQKMQDTALMLQINLRRAEKLMRQFKETAAHQTRTESSPVAFHELVVNLLASLSPVTQQIPVQPEVYIDPSLMLITDVDVWLQILTNLVMNSCRHAFDGVSMPGIRIQAYRNAQQELQFEYRDNGVGMSATVIARVFEPFFTTKAEQGGTGLGMSILKRLVEKKLQGSLQLQSSEGQGICLTISCLA